MGLFGVERLPERPQDSNDHSLISELCHPGGLWQGTRLVSHRSKPRDVDKEVSVGKQKGCLNRPLLGAKPNNSELDPLPNLSET